MNIHILVIIVMIILKGIFSAGDTALTYIDRNKLNSKSKKDVKAQRIKHLKENRIGFWGEIELVILTIELIATAYVAEFFVEPIAKWFDPLIMQGILTQSAVNFISIIIIGFGLTYLFLVFGYILPKQIARSNPDKMAYRTINILWFMSKLNKPFEVFVRFTTDIFSKIFRIPNTTEYRLTEKELKMLIRESMSDGIIGKEEKTIILNTIKFDAILVKEEMVSKDKVEFIELNSTHDEIIQKIRKNKYSRMPVYVNNEDNIVGIFNMKDVITENGIEKKIQIKDYLRQVIRVNKKDTLSHTFRKMQSERQMMALVYDEKDHLCGIITLEDIIERLVGEILDDNDKK